MFSFACIFVCILCILFLSFQVVLLSFIFAVDINRCFIIFIFYSRYRMGKWKKTNKLINWVLEWDGRWSNMSWVGFWIASNTTPHWWQEIMLNFHFLIARHWWIDADICAAHFNFHWYARQWLILRKVVILMGIMFWLSNRCWKYVILAAQKMQWGKLLGDSRC